MSKLILYGRVFLGLWVGEKKSNDLPPPTAHFLPHTLLSIITREKLRRFSFFKKKKKANNSLQEPKASMAFVEAKES